MSTPSPREQVKEPAKVAEESIPQLETAVEKDHLTQTFDEVLKTMEKHFSDPSKQKDFLLALSGEAKDSGVLPQLAINFGQKSFKDLDLNNSGAIDQQDLDKILKSPDRMRALNPLERMMVDYLAKNRQKIQGSYDEWGSNPDGITAKDLSEYGRKFKEELDHHKWSQKILKHFGSETAFDALDSDGNGWISKEDLRKKISRDRDRLADAEEGLEEMSAEKRKLIKERIDTANYMLNHRSEISSGEDDTSVSADFSRKDLQGYAKKHPAPQEGEMAPSVEGAIQPEAKAQASKSTFLPEALKDYMDKHFEELDMDGNGWVDHDELDKILDSARWSKALSKQDREILKHLKDHLSTIEEVADDETGDENDGASKLDLQKYKDREMAKYLAAHREPEKPAVVTEPAKPVVEEPAAQEPVAEEEQSEESAQPEKPKVPEGYICEGEGDQAVCRPMRPGDPGYRPPAQEVPEETVTEQEDKPVEGEVEPDTEEQPNTDYFGFTGQKTPEQKRLELLKFLDQVAQLTDQTNADGNDSADTVDALKEAFSANLKDQVFRDKIQTLADTVSDLSEDKKKALAEVFAGATAPQVAALAKVFADCKPEELKQLMDEMKAAEDYTALKEWFKKATAESIPQDVKAHLHPEQKPVEEKVEEPAAEERPDTPLEEAAEEGARGAEEEATEKLTAENYANLLKSYKYNAESYRAALEEAHKSGRPLVIVVGTGEAPKSFQQAAAAEAGKAAAGKDDPVYMYVDLATANQNSELVKWLKSQSDAAVARGNEPFGTLTFAHVERAANGNYSPGQPEDVAFGSAANSTEDLKRHVAAARIGEESKVSYYEYVDSGVKHATATKANGQKYDYTFDGKVWHWNPPAQPGQPPRHYTFNAKTREWIEVTEQESYSAPI